MLCASFYRRARLVSPLALGLLFVRLGQANRSRSLLKLLLPVILAEISHDLH
jgi:hypothetical protein